MSANILVTSQTLSVDVNTSTNTINVSSTPNTVELNLEPKLTLTQIRNNFFAGFGLDYNNVSGTFSVDVGNHLDQNTTDDLAEGNTNIYFTEQRVLDTVLNNDVKLKSVSETVVDAGNISGAITVDVTDGTIFTGNVTGNITQIAFANVQAGSTTTLLLRQDESGNHQLETGLLGDWIFTDNNSDLETDPFAFTLISVFYTGNKFVASVTPFVQKTTDSLAEGTTNLYFTDARARDAISVQSPILYDQANGVLSIDESELFGGKTTDDLAEGNVNLYFTTQRARDSVSADGDLSYNNSTGVFSVTTYKSADFDSDFSGKTTTDLSEGTNLYYTDSRVQSLLDTGVVDALFTGDVVIQGNLEVLGNVDYVTVEDLLVKDHEIVLNFGNASAQDAFITVDRSGSALGNAQIRWNETADAWEFSNNGSNYQPIPTSTTDLVEGNNLYFTDARANAAIGAYQADINTPGNISAGVFFGDGGNLSNIDTGANLATSTTDDLSEGNTNLYYTDLRARDSLSAGGDLNYDSANGVFSVTTYKSTDFDTDFDAKTTDDLDEGAVNLYYADARARAAISSGDDNIDYANGVITLSNTLSNVDTITSSTDTLLLQAVDSQQRILPGLTVDAQGYALLDTVAGNFGDPLGDNFDWIQYSGNTAIETFAVEMACTQGSPTVQLNAIRRRGEVIRGNTSVDMGLINNIVPGMVWRTGLTPNSFPFPGGTVPKVISVDTGNNSITFDQVATTTITVGVGTNNVSDLLNPAMHDETTGLSVLLRPDFDFDSASSTDTNTLLDTLIDSGPASMMPTSAVYAYPKTGFEPEDFVFSSGSASDYTIDSAKLGNVLVGKTTISPETGEINLARGLTIGESTNLTTRAVGTGQIPGFGINSVWNGLQQDYTTEGQAQAAAHQIYLGTFSDLTQGIPGRLYFSAFTGNANDDEFDWYPRGGECLGRIQWTAPTIRQGQGISTVNGPAAISVFAAKEFDTSFDSGMDMYLIASAHTDNRTVSQGAPQTPRGSDTFLSFERGEVVIASSQEFTGVFPNYDAQPHKSVKIAPSVPGPSEFPRNRYTDQSTLWADFNYSNVSAKTGSRLAVTNGGSIGAGTVGDMVLDLERADNTGNVLTTWTTPFPAFKIVNQGQFGSPTTFITVTSLFDGLSDGDPVIIDNVDEPAGNVLNGNVFFVQQSNNPVLNYRLWMNSDLDQPVNIGIDSTSAPDATIEFNVQSGVSAKAYSFRLAEQSNDLEILVDGSLHSTIKANGEIHNAAGSKYITETDFDTLFDARLAQEFPTLLSDNAALIQQIAAGNVEPDYDGGTASTATFDFTVDGGDATTTEFTDTVEGGNAEGNSIVEGGFSSTTVYASTEDGGNASTTEFDQTIDGGNA